MKDLWGSRPKTCLPRHGSSQKVAASVVSRGLHQGERPDPQRRVVVLARGKPLLVRSEHEGVHHLRGIECREAGRFERQGVG